MSQPDVPNYPCPECGDASGAPLNVSYTYKADGNPADPNVDKILSATTYTLECVACGHKYAVCESDDNS